MSSQISLVFFLTRCVPPAPSISPLLRWVNLNVITNAECAQTYGGIVKSTVLCTGGGSRSGPAGSCNVSSKTCHFIRLLRTLLRVSSLLWSPWKPPSFGRATPAAR